MRYEKALTQALLPNNHVVPIKGVHSEVGQDVLELKKESLLHNSEKALQLSSMSFLVCMCIRVGYFLYLHTLLRRCKDA